MPTAWIPAASSPKALNKNCISLFIYSLSNLNIFTNSNFREALKKDLMQDDDNKRELTTIDVISAEELFKILKVYNPGCDANGNYVIEG